MTDLFTFGDSPRVHSGPHLLSVHVEDGIASNHGKRQLSLEDGGAVRKGNQVQVSQH